MGHILIQNVYFLQNKFNNKCTLTDLCPKCTLLRATSVLGISLGVYQTRKERNILFNDAVVVYLHLYGVRCTQIAREEGRKEMLYLTTHSTHFIYGYMASDIWLRTILIVRKETHCRHICYSFRLTARVLLYAPSHRQDSTYHGLCYTSRGALAGTRNS